MSDLEFALARRIGSRQRSNTWSRGLAAGLCERYTGPRQLLWLLLLLLLRWRLLLLKLLLLLFVLVVEEEEEVAAVVWCW